MTKNGITVVYVRSNEAYDIYRVMGNGFSKYVEMPRNCGYTEEDVLNDYID